MNTSLLDIYNNLHITHDKEAFTSIPPSQGQNKKYFIVLF
jgi:hypothetical protein